MLFLPVTFGYHHESAGNEQGLELRRKLVYRTASLGLHALKKVAMMWNYHRRTEFFLFSQNVAYVGVPKAASTTIKHKCSELGLFDVSGEADIANSDLDPQRIHGWLRNSSFHVKPADFKKALRLSPGFAFLIVRRPRERLESFYKDKVMGAGWNKPAIDVFQNVYGIMPGEPWDTFLEKVLAVPGPFQNPHLRSITETLGAARLKSRELKVYSSSCLADWERDLSQYLSQFSEARLAKGQGRLSAKNVSSFTGEWDWNLPPRLARRFEKLYGPDEKICDSAEKS